MEPRAREKNKDIVSGPAIRNAKFIRKALIAKNRLSSDLIVRPTVHPKKIFIMIQDLLKKEDKTGMQWSKDTVTACVEAYT